MQEIHVPMWRFSEIIKEVCMRDTSASPNDWTPENPLWGHCAVVAVLAHNLYGGTIFRATLDGTDFEFMRSHYWNMIRGQEMDFTSEQFGNNYPKGMIPEPRSRDCILSNDLTRKRYETLAARFNARVRKTD